jgi:hypothetical protein
MAGEPFRGVLSGWKDEHRPFVMSSWPLYMAEGELTTAVASQVRRISSYMPITVITRDRSLVLGGPDDEPELYDLTSDPGEQHNVWREANGEGAKLCEDAISFLESIGTPEEHLSPRREALDRWWKGAVRS